MEAKTSHRRADRLIVLADEKLNIISLSGKLRKIKLVKIAGVGFCIKDLLENWISEKEIDSLINKSKKNINNENIVNKGNYRIYLYFLIKYFILIIDSNINNNLDTDYLKNVIHYSPGFTYLKDNKFRYIMCNVNFAKAAGLNYPEDIFGKTDFDLPWAQTEAKLFRKGDIEALSGKIQINFEETQRQADGSTKNVLANKVPLYDSNNKIIGILGNYLDITDRKKIEAELKVAKEKSEAANEAKSEFLRNMEHQLRTPFSGVYSMVELLANKEKDPQKKEMLELTYQSAKEFYELLNNIIDFSRFQADRTLVLAKKINLRKLIEKAITMEKAVVTVKKLKLTFNYSKSIPENYISDDIRIERIVLNLLSNAIKFTEKGKINITVKLAKRVDKRNVIIKIIVSDTGIGISEDNQQLIYEKFYRESPANQNKYRGAGLGLHIVKQLVEDLEGEIEVKSVKGSGTKFICTLPLKCSLLD